MPAENPARRKGSARELAERIGCSPRTIQKLWAEPRFEFEARAKARQMEALALREQGLSYRRIGQRLGVSRDSAAGLVRRARQKVSTAA